MEYFHIAMVILWNISAAFLVWGTIYTIWRAQFAPSPVFNEHSAPPVSILKPLCGNDPQLFENLESFLHIDYPEYEVIFFLADAKDPAFAVLIRLHQKYPEAGFRIVLSDSTIGPNPKVANLDRAWSLAKYDVVLCSDSNVRADRNYLREAIPLLVDAPNTGIVTGFVQCFGAENFGGNLEEATWNTFYARWVNIGRSFGVGFVIGKSMLFKRSVAARFGGLSAFAHHVAEDYMIGRAMNSLGKSVDVQHKGIPQFVGKRSLREYWQRALRWNLLQKYSAPVAFFGTPTQFPVVIGALTCSVRYAEVTLCLWLVMDMLLMTALGGRPRPFTWMLSQILAPLIWVNALVKDHVVWRGNTMRIGKGGWLK
jgi:ceramide glucosyltransferase